MENLFYFAVKLAAVGYILYRLWVFLFRDGERLWKWIPVRAPKPKAVAVKAIQPAEPAGVVGRTHAVVLTDPRAEPQPVHTTPLEPTGYIGEDEPLNPDDIETDFDPPEAGYIPSNEELYGDDPVPDDDPELSGGLTFEEIGNAVTVLTATGEVDEQQKTQAALTLYAVQDTVIIDFITSEVSDLVSVQNLLQECLDGDGFPRSKKVNSIEDVRLKDFDIEKFV